MSDKTGDSTSAFRLRKGQMSIPETVAYIYIYIYIYRRKLDFSLRSETAVQIKSVQEI